VNYDTFESASNAFSQAKQNPAFSKFFVGEPFISYHKNKIELAKEKKLTMNYRTLSNLNFKTQLYFNYLFLAASSFSQIPQYYPYPYPFPPMVDPHYSQFPPGGQMPPPASFPPKPYPPYQQYPIRGSPQNYNASYQRRGRNPGGAFNGPKNFGTGGKGYSQSPQKMQGQYVKKNFSFQILN
jgi:hypothetical protein